MMLEMTFEQEEALFPVIDFVSSCNVAKALAIKTFGTDPDGKKAVLSLLDRCLSINGDRNRVAHGYWFASALNAFDQGEPFAALHSSRSSISASLYFKRKGELDNKADEIRDVSAQLAQLVRSRCWPSTEADT